MRQGFHPMLKYPRFRLTPLLVTLLMKACLLVVDSYAQVEACISEPGGIVYASVCVC